MLRALSVTAKVLLAILLYPVVAVLSFWRFGDEGVTAEAVLLAVVLNFAFGFAFRWPSIVLPAVVFPAWYLSTSGSCENCDVILDCGAYSLAAVALGAGVRHLVRLTGRRWPVERA
jgi:hypothetical protein